MMGTEIFKIDASWAEILTKTRVPFLSAPTVGHLTASKGHLRATISYRSPGHLRVTIGHM